MSREIMVRCDASLHCRIYLYRYIYIYISYLLADDVMQSEEQNSKQNPMYEAAPGVQRAPLHRNIHAIA